MNRTQVLRAVALFVLAAAGCASTSNGTTGSGGNSGSGGTNTGGSGQGDNGSGGSAGSGGDTNPGSGGGSPMDLPRLVTSVNNGFWKTDGALTEVTSNADVTVNDGSPAQTWEGFGGAFNELGWKYLQMLDGADRDGVLKALFSAEGANFQFGRIPMGASDYALDRYTLDEHSGNDPMAAGFSIDRDMQSLIPYIKAAQGIRSDIRFWSSPWTPPTWMKSGMKTGNQPSPFDGGNMKDDDTALTALAQYFVKFVKAYGDLGIKIEAVAPQNEPNYDQNYPSCLWATALYTKFVGKYLGPALDGMNVSIMLGTMSNSDKDPAIVSSVMGDAAAKKYIKLLGYQWGMQSAASGAKMYHLPVWQTEHKCGNYPWKPSDYPSFNATKAPNDMAYAQESWTYLRDWIKGGVTSYSAWNMVLDNVGLGIDTTRAWPQNALITIDPGNKKATLTPAYYVFRHVSQFVQAGAQVVGASASDALAFKNPDGSLVAVLYNAGGSKKLTVGIGGKKLQFDMPGTGWATINYK